MTTESTASTPSVAEMRRKAFLDVFGPEYSESLDVPVRFLDNEVLNSPLAIQFFKRHFRFISKTLNNEYKYRVWKGFDQTVLDHYVDVVNKKLGLVSNNLKQWNNRFKNLMEQQGAEPVGMLYPNPLTTTVPIINQAAWGFFNLLKDMDQLCLIAAEANMAGVIVTKQRTEAEQFARKQISSFNHALTQEAYKIYNEARRLSRRGDSATDAQTKLLDEHGKELAEFSVAQEQDGDVEGSGRPGQLISDSAAEAIAAASQTGKPATKRVARKTGASPETAEGTGAATAADQSPVATAA